MQTRLRRGTATTATGYGRTFWIVNGAIFLDEVVYIALVPLLPLYAHRFALSVGDAGLLYGCYPLAAFLSSVPAGLLADRVGPRVMLIAALSMFVIASVAFAAAHSAPVLLLARGIQGLAGGVTATVGIAAIALSVPAAKRGATIGVTTGFSALSSFAGPLFAALGASAIGLGAVYAIPAGVAVGLIAALVRAVPPESRVELTHSGISGIRATLGSQLRERAVVASIAAVMAVGIAGSAVQTLAPLQLHSEGLSASELGVLVALAALIALALSPLVGRLADRRGVRATTAVWAALSVTLVAGFALAHWAWLVSVLLVAFLPQIRVGATLAYTRGTTHTSSATAVATGLGLAIAAWSIGAAVGPIVAGYAEQLTSRSAAYIFVAILTALTVTPALLPSGRSAPVRAADQRSSRIAADRGRTGVRSKASINDAP
jgi:MFS family permease